MFVKGIRIKVKIKIRMKNGRSARTRRADALPLAF